MQKYGTTLADFAKVRAKASRHGANNPLSVFRNVMTEEDVLAAQVIWPGVMTKPMACPPTCGAAAATTFDAHDMIHLVGSDMTQRAAQSVYEAAGVGPSDIRVVEMHDCFAHNEVITYEGLGRACLVTLYEKVA